MNKWMGIAAASTLALLTGTDAHAGGFTPWGTATGDKVVGLSPYFFANGDGTFTLSPYVFFGATDHFDIMFGYSVNFNANDANGIGSVTSGAIEIMPRGIINDHAIFALHAFITPPVDSDDVLVDGAVEFHGLVGAERFTFTYNAGWGYTISPDFGGHSAFFILVPEYAISDRVSAFVELNPGFSDAGGGDFSGSMDIVPGVTVILDEAGNHSLTPAVTFSLAGPQTAANFGLLYWGAFDIGGKKSAQNRRNSVSGDRMAQQRRDRVNRASFRSF